MIANDFLFMKNIGSVNLAVHQSKLTNVISESCMMIVVNSPFTVSIMIWYCNEKLDFDNSWVLTVRVYKTKIHRLTRAWDKEKSPSRIEPGRTGIEPGLTVFGRSWAPFLLGMDFLFFVPHSCHVHQFTFQQLICLTGKKDRFDISWDYMKTFSVSYCPLIAGLIRIQ